jgi:hypothetical protein
MQTTSTQGQPLTGRLAPLAALGYHDFRLLWFGNLVSTAGSQMRIVAVNVQIYELAKASGRIDPALALGLVGLARHPHSADRAVQRPGGRSGRSPAAVSLRSL